MEVMVGITFTIDVPSSSPPSLTYGGDQPGGDTVERPILSSFLDGRSGYRVGGQPEFFASVSSESSSSIGTPDDNDDENDDVSSKREMEEEEVQSKLKGLGSLEDSLPIKRGLSSHFVGKSKSFTDLSQVSTVKELQKQENPFNKRRRVLIVSKWSRRSSFYCWSNPKSMPLLGVDEEEDDYDEAEDKVKKVSPSSSSSSSEEKKPEEDQVQLRQLNRVPQSYATHMRLRLGSLKSRSFSLAYLQEHDNEEEEEDNDD